MDVEICSLAETQVLPWSSVAVSTQQANLLPS